MSHSQGFTQPLWLLDIVHGPFNIVKSYPRYCTRGYAFRVRNSDTRRKTADAGVSTTSGEITYYGVLDEILEVTYPGGLGLTCIVFNCVWYDPINGVKVDEFGVTYVHSKKFMTKFDPFIIASQADQVCYLSYPLAQNRRNPWVVVTSISPRGTIIGNADNNPLQENMEGHFTVAYDMYVDLTLEGEDDIPQVLEDEGEEFENDIDSIPTTSEDESE